MDDMWSGASGQNAALVILTFLEADCTNSEYQKELLSLGRELNLTRDIKCNGSKIDDPEDGDLETDGHLPFCISDLVDDIRPSVEPQWPRNHEAAARLQQVAYELRDIAAQLERDVVARATRNLSNSISASPSEQWKNLLTWEVERAMRQGVCLEHLPQERVFIALTLTLVKGVCEQAPLLLRNLFNAALCYIRPASAR